MLTYLPQRRKKNNMHLETCSINNKYMPHVTPLAPPNPQINYSKKRFLEFFSPKLKRFTKLLFWAKRLASGEIPMPYSKAFVKSNRFLVISTIF
jgi:hypothetical protein